LKKEGVEWKDVSQCVLANHVAYLAEGGKRGAGVMVQRCAAVQKEYLLRFGKSVGGEKMVVGAVVRGVGKKRPAEAEKDDQTFDIGRVLDHVAKKLGETRSLSDHELLQKMAFLLMVAGMRVGDMIQIEQTRCSFGEEQVGGTQQNTHRARLVALTKEGKQLRWVATNLDGQNVVAELCLHCVLREWVARLPPVASGGAGIVSSPLLRGCGRRHPSRSSRL